MSRRTTSSSIEFSDFDDYDVDSSFDNKLNLGPRRYAPRIDKDIYCKIILEDTEQCITTATRAKYFYSDLFVNDMVVELVCSPKHMTGMQMVAFIWNYVSNKRSNKVLPHHLNELLNTMNCDKIMELGETAFHLIADANLLYNILNDLEDLLPDRFKELATMQPGQYVPQDSDYGMFGYDIDDYLYMIETSGPETPVAGILRDVIVDTFKRRYATYFNVWCY